MDTYFIPLLVWFDMVKVAFVAMKPVQKKIMISKRFEIGLSAKEIEQCVMIKRTIQKSV